MPVAVTSAVTFLIAASRDSGADCASILSSWAGRRPWLERHLKWLYWVCAAGLAPWVAYLYLFQIPSGPAHQIHLMTADLILAIIAGLLLTAWTYHRRWSLAVMAASSTATAMFMSVRFRLITGAGGPHWVGSIPALLALAVTVVMLCAFVITNRLSTRAHVRWLPAALTALALALVPLLVVDLTAELRHTGVAALSRTIVGGRGTT